MIAVRDDRIAVIGLRRDQIDLVAALRPHFLIPQLPGVIERQPQDIAVAERPDLRGDAALIGERIVGRSEEHTSELQSLMRNSYAVFCLKQKNNNDYTHDTTYHRHTQ